MSGAALLPPTPAERIAARQAWAKQAAAALREAYRQMDRRCVDAVSYLDDDALGRLIAEEQAKVTAIRAQMVAVAERDMWPREFYWGGI